MATCNKTFEDLSADHESRIAALEGGGGSSFSVKTGSMIINNPNDSAIESNPPATNSIFYEDRNGGTPGTVSIIEDEASIFTTDGSLETGISYLEVPACDAIQFHVNFSFDTNDTTVRVAYVEVGQYVSPTSITSLNIPQKCSHVGDNTAYDPYFCFSTRWFKVVASEPAAYELEVNQKICAYAWINGQYVTPVYPVINSGLGYTVFNAS